MMESEAGARPCGFRRPARRSLLRRVAGASVVALLVGAAWVGAPALLAAQGEKEVIAVLDLEAAGASDVEATGLSDKLREELLRTGSFTLADRNNIEAALEELALQQAGCTTQECALQVGRFLGVRKMVVGKVTKFNDNLWQVSGLLLDVETTQTVRAESVIHEGSLISLLRTGMTDLARKLAATPEVAGTERMARLTVEVDPPDAMLLVDNRAWPHDGGRITRNIEPGRHVVEARDPSGRHNPQNRIVEIAAGQDFVVSLTLTPKGAATAQAPLDTATAKQKCLDEVHFMLHPKHDRFVSAVVLSSSSGAYALSSFVTTYAVDRNNCEKNFALAPGTWERVRFVAVTHEWLGEDFARGGGPTMESLAALLDCPPQAVPLLADAGRRGIGRVLLTPEDDALRYLLRVEAELARTPALSAACARLRAGPPEDPVS